MAYYRIAYKRYQSAQWQWKSTKLTSLDAIFRFLKFHHAFPADQLRIFSSSSIEDLNKLLEAENQGEQHTSVTAEQFLRERGLFRTQTVEGVPAQSHSTLYEDQQRKVITETLTPLPDQQYAQAALTTNVQMNEIDRRRFQEEMGVGGDHDLPYVFALPTSLSQTRAWVALMSKVQRGEMEA